MPKFSVLITRDASEHANVEVVARNAREAEQKAIEFARENPHVEWFPDEGNYHGPYLADPGNCATKVE